MATLWEQLGSDDEARRGRLRTLLEDFYGRVYRDPMIGFFFAGVDKDRLVERETQFTEVFFGGESAYEGRPLEQAHASHRIFGGQFMRRQQILREVLVDHDFPTAVRDGWIEHNETLRPLVTRHQGSDCE